MLYFSPISGSFFFLDFREGVCRLGLFCIGVCSYGWRGVIAVNVICNVQIKFVLQCFGIVSLSFHCFTTKCVEMIAYSLYIYTYCVLGDLELEFDTSNV